MRSESVVQSFHNISHVQQFIMNSTASWPLFASTPIDSRIDLIGQQNELKSSFNKMIAQNNTSNEFNKKPDDLSSPLHLDKQQNQHQQQIQHSFSHSNSNSNNNNNNNNSNSNATNGGILNLRIDDSRDDEFDDDEDDDDSMIDSIGDDSLPSPDAMYATSYISNDSNGCTTNDRNGIHDDTNERFSGSNSKDDINEGQRIGDHPSIGPLAQLQNALERHSGMLGMSLTDFSSPNGTNSSLFGGSVSFGGNSLNPMGTPTGMQFNPDSDITGELYRCHLCSYTGTSKFHFNAHMNTHFDHKCPFCDYTSRTEGRLKRHIRDFHSEVPPDSWAGTRVLKENSPNDGEESLDANDTSGNGSNGNKNRKYKCKQCEYVATCKQEFWDHSKSHIKSEKLLTCPKCNFVTEYKHHLEYHLRNHFGSKPFKCAKCNYSCVNKSMLNSHMKSHSNIYQYRCADCSYATKYCHSLKLHLRKYQHKPATVLNLDGTPNPYPVIDVYGTRRGPRPKKSKSKSSHNKSQNMDSSSLSQTPIISSPMSPNMMNSTPIPPLINTSMPMPGLPFIFPPTSAFLHSGLLGPQGMPQLPHLPNQLHHQTPHSLYDSSTIPKSSPSPAAHTKNQSPVMNKLKCNFCDFTTDIRELFGKHLLLHVATENQDICKMYGMNPTAEMLQQNAIINELAARQSPNSRRFLEQIAINPSFMNTLFGMHSLPKSEQIMALEWHSPKESTDSHGSIGLSSHPVLALTDSRPESAPIKTDSKNILSPLPRSRSSPSEKYSAQSIESDKSGDKIKTISSDTTPLDLSSNKSSSPLTHLEPKISLLKQHITQLPQFENKQQNNQQEEQSRLSPLVQMAPKPQQEEAQQEQQQSRAQRRKGRASKLNVNRICIKINDESPKKDINEEISNDTSESLHEESDVDNIISKINNATSLLQEILIDMYSLKNDTYH